MLSKNNHANPIQANSVDLAKTHAPKVPHFVGMGGDDILQNCGVLYIQYQVRERERERSSSEGSGTKRPSL